MIIERKNKIHTHFRGILSILSKLHLTITSNYTFYKLNGRRENYWKSMLPTEICQSVKTEM